MTRCQTPVRPNGILSVQSLYAIARQLGMALSSRVFKRLRVDTSSILPGTTDACATKVVSPSAESSMANWNCTEITTARLRRQARVWKPGLEDQRLTALQSK